MCPETKWNKTTIAFNSIMGAKTIVFNSISTVTLLHIVKLKMERQPLKFTLAVSNCQGFCWRKQCFYGNDYYYRSDYFLVKYTFSLQFVILISRQNYCLNKRYHLHVLEEPRYVLQEVRSIIYFWQFIHPLSLYSCGNGTSFAFTSYIIVSAKFCNVAFLNNFYFVSFFYHLFICWH